MLWKTAPVCYKRPLTPKQLLTPGWTHLKKTKKWMLYYFCRACLAIFSHNLHIYDHYKPQQSYKLLWEWRKKREIQPNWGWEDRLESYTSSKDEIPNLFLLKFAFHMRFNIKDSASCKMKKCIIIIIECMWHTPFTLLRPVRTLAIAVSQFSDKWVRRSRKLQSIGRHRLKKT